MVSDTEDHAKWQNTAILAAMRASDVIKEGFSADFTVKQKSHLHDVVTPYDVAAEKAIIEIIQKEYPQHAIVAEESGSQGDPDKGVTWIIDPIDGTWNFARKIPAFATSIAVYHKGHTVAAVCFDPISDELFTSIRGQGAKLNGKDISVSNVDQLQKSGISLGMTSSPQNLTVIGNIRRAGSTVLDMCYTAKGALEGFIEWDLQIWDFAGAQLILEEAGGKCTDIAGHPIDIKWGNKQSVLASNASINKDLLTWTSTVKK